MPIKIAVVPAGGGSLDWKETTGSYFKALAEVDGEPMYMWVVKALREAGFEKILVVADWVPALVESETCTLVPGSTTLVDNILIGLVESMRYQETPENVMLAMADTPGIKAESITRVVGSCEKMPGLSLTLSVVPVDVCRAAIPGVKRTSAKVDGISYTLGSLAVVDPRVLLTRRQQLERVVEIRKSKFKLACMLGFKILFGLLSGTLKMAAIENRVVELLKLEAGSVRAIICDQVADAALGNDWDKSKDYQSKMEQVSA